MKALLTSRFTTWTVVLLSLGMFGCATIMHGSSQEIGFQSQPSGATVFVDDRLVGETPTFAELRRGSKHTVRFELGGYQPHEAVITKGTSGWVWGNIVFGGLIGLAVDAISGGMYKLKPEQVEAELQSTGQSELNQRSDMIILVVLEPDPSWERIGTLTRTY